MAFSNQGARAYVTNQFGASISVIDTTSHAVIATVPTGAGEPYGIAITPDDARLYVADISAGRVWAIDATTHAVTATLPIRAFATYGRFIAPGAGGGPPVVTPRAITTVPTNATWALIALALMLAWIAAVRGTPR